MKSADNVAELTRLLNQIDDRASQSARLRQLMPHIQASLHTGLSYADVVADLTNAGFPIKLRLFERVLYRWRKAQRATLPSSTTAPPAEQPATSLPLVVSDPQSRQRIETPGDLRNIRNMKIDLEALRQEGIAKRKNK